MSAEELNKQCSGLQARLKTEKENLKVLEENFFAFLQGKRSKFTSVDGISNLIVITQKEITDLESKIRSLGCEDSSSINLSDPQLIIGASVPRRKSPFEISPA